MQIYAKFAIFRKIFRRNEGRDNIIRSIFSGRHTIRHTLPCTSRSAACSHPHPPLHIILYTQEGTFVPNCHTFGNISHRGCLKHNGHPKPHTPAWPHPGNHITIHRSLPEKICRLFAHHYSRQQPARHPLRPHNREQAIHDQGNEALLFCCRSDACAGPVGITYRNRLCNNLQDTGAAGAPPLREGCQKCCRTGIHWRIYGIVGMLPLCGEGGYNDFHLQDCQRMLPTGGEDRNNCPGGTHKLYNFTHADYLNRVPALIQRGNWHFYALPRMHRCIPTAQYREEMGWRDGRKSVGMAMEHNLALCMLPDCHTASLPVPFWEQCPVLSHYQPHCSTNRHCHPLFIYRCHAAATGAGARRSGPVYTENAAVLSEQQHFIHCRIGFILQSPSPQ